MSKEFTLDKVFDNLRKKHGDGYVFVAEDKKDEKVSRCSTGIFALDVSLYGGVPVGKVIQFSGSESSGKTTSSLIIAADFTKRGEKVVWIDVENAFDYEWAKRWGIDMSLLYVMKSSTIEQVTDAVELVLATKDAGLIVVDSIAAAISSSELDAEAEKDSYGGNAKAIGKMCRKMTARKNLYDINTTIIVINQLRENLSMYGPKEYEPGGRQLRHFTDVLIRLKATSDIIGDKENPDGIVIKYLIKKNRTGKPLKRGAYTLMFDGSIANEDSMIQSAIVNGLVERAGAWFKYEGEKYQGMERLKKALTDEDYDKFKTFVMEGLINDRDSIVADVIDEDDDTPDIEVD